MKPETGKRDNREKDREKEKDRERERASIKNSFVLQQAEMGCLTGWEGKRTLIK